MMEQRWPWLMLGSIFWTAAIGLMVTASLMGSHAAAGWSVLSALVACVLSGKMIVDCATARERICVEELAVVLAREAVRAAGLHPVRG